jgi:hypothetical protein
MRIGIPPHLVCCLASLALWALAGFQSLTAQDDQESKALANFESKIRPLLEKHCIDCHSGESPKGNLDLSNSNGWKTAKVILPHDPKNSLLMTVITSEDPDVKMPPPPKDPLRNTEVLAIKEWILSGAFDPRFENATNTSSIGPRKRNRVFEITDEDRTFWAFQPISPTPGLPPQSNLTPSAKIDFLVGDLELPTASPRERIRRLFADLWGLPPSFEDVQAFEHDPSPEHWNQIVNRLLDSHHYGERWGRYWLDWVRYAETNGYERDGLKPHAWRYRDYVIEAFAKDKPYNQFIIEQLAGDQWAQSQNFNPENQPEIWREAIIATGFYRLHVWDDEPDDTTAAELDDADDVMVTIGSAFLGLTIGCARCHDHKFDPISQHDYYSLLSFMRGIDPYGLSKKGGGGRGTGKIQRYLVAESQSIAWEKDRQNQIAEKEKLLIASTDPAQRLMIEGQINALGNLIPPFDAALSVFEIGPTPKPTHVLHRGDPNSPKDLVPSRTPQILNPKIDSPNQLHRLELARWIADERNPMTARVLVNRIWQRHFGVGIVPSIDDFGRTGQLPANLPLLDYLSSELIASGWSIKHLHRIILLSESYNKTSSPRIDSEHSLYAQPQLRRLDAETIRDSILKISGQLNDKRSGPSIYPSLSQEVKDSANPVSVSMWQESPIQLQDCRSVYLIVKRSLKVPFLESLDFANSTSPTAIRTVTTTAPQALLLLNDPWMHQKAEQLSKRLQVLAGDELRKQVDHLWQLAYQRRATDEELQLALEYLDNNPQRMISLCRAILNSSEFLYVD